MTIQTLGYFSEALIFCYIGIGIFEQPQQDWSITFIGYEMLIIVVGRLGSVIIVEYLFVLFRAEHSLKFKECVFLAYAGMIRGAIALGLAIKAQNVFTEYDTMVTTVLALVILSTLVFGSFMPAVAKCLLEKPGKSKSPKERRPRVSFNDQDVMFDHLDRRDNIEASSQQSPSFNARIGNGAH